MAIGTNLSISKEVEADPSRMDHSIKEAIGVLFHPNSSSGIEQTRALRIKVRESQEILLSGDGWSWE